jgi:hypothetical protein
LRLLFEERRDIMNPEKPKNKYSGQRNKYIGIAMRFNFQKTDYNC